MKKKIGEIYNKPIVIGNPNEFNKNEVALNALDGKDLYGLEYYLTNGIELPEVAILHCICRQPSDQKCKLYTSAPINLIIAIAVPTKLYVGPDALAKDMIVEELKNAKQITAKEYYSLID